MSAPMLNLSTVAGPAQAGAAAGKAGAAAQGPLAGFEALMAAFFGAQGQGAAVQMFVPPTVQAAAGAAAAVVGAVATALDGKPAETGTPDGASADAAAAVPGAEATDAAKTDDSALPDASLALLAALVVPAAAQPQAAATVAAAETPAPAQDKTAGPAIPQPDLLADAQAAVDAAAGQALGDANPLADAAPAGRPLTSAQAKAAAPPQAAPAAAPPAPTAQVAPPAQPAAQPQAMAAEAAAAPAPVQAAEAQAPAPAPVKDKAASRTERAEAGRPGALRTEPFAPADASIHADAPLPAGTDAAKGELAQAAADHAEAAAALEPEVAAAHDADQPAQPAASTSASVSAPATAPPSAPIVRGSPETVANMAAQIVKKLEGRSTRFDLELDPAGLGRVDVRVEINAHGRLSAAMSFDNPGAAAELKSRANDLQKALEQAGFDMSGGMSFDVAGDQGRPGQGFAGQAGQERDTGAAFRGRAFQAALDNAGEADAAARPLNLRRGVTAGLDVRI